MNAKNLWVGDGKHPLCSVDCADAYAEDNLDAEHDGERYVRCSGFVEDGYTAEDFEPGEVCKWCKAPIEGVGT